MTLSLDRTASLFAERYPLLASPISNHPTKLLLAACGLLFGIQFAIYGYAILTAEDLLSFAGVVVVGDFIVFWAGAQEILLGKILSLYDESYFSQLIRQEVSEREMPVLLWLYPPTMFFIVVPFGLLPTMQAYGAWIVLYTSAFALTLWRLWPKPIALFFAMTSCVTLHAWITGQTGFLTASLLVIAATMPSRAPLLAGLAAGLLTIKPQFGLLIPIAYLAAGYWRAFYIAAVAGAVLIGASYLAFGLEAWLAFFEAMGDHSARLHGAGFSFNKLTSPFGGLAILGTPTEIALTIHFVLVAFLAGFVGVVWRKAVRWEVQAMVLCAGAALASPYAFYYELPICVAAMFLLAKRGVESGWLRGERIAIALMWLLPVYLPGNNEIPGFPLAFALALGVFSLCARRALVELGYMGRRDFIAAESVPSSR